jgi:hypothetical protein
MKTNRILIRCCHERSARADYSGSWDQDLITATRPPKAPAFAVLTGVPRLTPPQAIHDHFSRVGRVLGVGFRPGATGDTQVLVTFLDERTLDAAVAALDQTVFRLATIGVRRNLPQTGEATAQDQQDLLRAPALEKVPVGPHRIRKHDQPYRQFCATFRPALRSALPVNREEADAILTHIYENLPYTMRLMGPT